MTDGVFLLVNGLRFLRISKRMSQQHLQTKLDHLLSSLSSPIIVIVIVVIIVVVIIIITSQFILHKPERVS
jgi:hypothetical protein